MRLNKDHVLREIRRIAEANGGVPPGINTFNTETGIKRHQVVGVFWPRWSDAIREAGFEANRLQVPYARADLLKRYVVLARELGRLPTKGDLGVKHRIDPQFPSLSAWQRFAEKAKLVELVQNYCKEQGYEDVVSMCEEYVPRAQSQEPGITPGEDAAGFVYLIKSGRFYKIGRTNATGRREYELALQLPERASKIHEIRTDDPSGIEAYWHRRFEARRKNGEWFELTAADVTAFKQRKFM
jgi:hypothetical protein